MDLSLSLLTKLNIKTELSLWFVPLCLLLGLVYAYVLYNKKSPWSNQINYLLATVRGLIVALMAFFLLGPLLNQISYTDEKPIIVLNLDNSQSISPTDSAIVQGQIDQITNALESKEIEVRLKGLSNYLNNDQVNFEEPSTNLSNSLKSIGQDFEQQNLIGAILISDGIHNSGSSPQFLTLTYPVFSVGIGDTIPARDLSIKNLNYNKVVYEGKRFIIKADIYNNGYINEPLQVQLLSGSTVIQSKSLTPKGDQQINSLEFIIDADAVGIRSYQIRIIGKEGEMSIANNTRRAFVEVIDSQQKILIAAKSPHPDIKALRTIIEAKEGTDVSLWINGYTTDFPEGPFDLVIYHQLPGFNDLPQEIDHWIDDSNSLFISGTEDLDNLNRRNKAISYSNYGQTDQVIGNLDASFDLFEIDGENMVRMVDYPPITVPYGTFELKENAQVMLFQKIGNTQTNRPLLSVWSDDERKSAVFSGAGIWKWRLQESAIYETADLFDELFGKLIQYLATTDNKSNFIVEPLSESFTNSDPVEFNTEVYNQLYEQVYDYNISMKLRDEDNEIVEYNYVNNPDNDFSINNLESGVYQYEATVFVNNQQEVARGSFSVEALQLENIDLTANHQILRNIAKNSGGKFYKSDQVEQLIDDINAINPRPISRSSEDLNPLIDNPLWLILLITLLSFEWFMRKYHGSY